MPWAREKHYIQPKDIHFHCLYQKEWFQGREQEKHSSDWPAASVPVTPPWAVKILRLVPVPEPVQHRAEPVFLQGSQAFQKVKKKCHSYSA